MFLWSVWPSQLTLNTQQVENGEKRTALRNVEEIVAKVMIDKYNRSAKLSIIIDVHSPSEKGPLDQNKTSQRCTENGQP